MCYSLLVIHEENFQKPMLNRLIGSKHAIDQVSLSAAYKLHQYGIGLIKTYTPWDKQTLPNPEEYSDAESFYIEKANGVFRTATAFILCHELAHIKYGHLDNPGNYVADADSKLDEMQADSDAFFTMIKGASDHVGKINYGIGMVIGFCSLLLLQAGLQSKTHPDIDDRVETILRLLELDDISPLWGFAALSFKLWDEHYDKKLVWPKEVVHVKHLFYTIHSQLKATK